MEWWRWWLASLCGIFASSYVIHTFYMDRWRRWLASLCHYLWSTPLTWGDVDGWHLCVIISDSQLLMEWWCWWLASLCHHLWSTVFTWSGDVDGWHLCVIICDPHLVHGVVMLMAGIFVSLVVIHTLYKEWWSWWLASLCHQQWSTPCTKSSDVDDWARPWLLS